MNPRIAIVADWLTVYGGAEHVIAEFHELWPDAPLFTTVTRPEKMGPMKNADIRASRLQQLYAFVKRHQLLLGQMPRTVETLDLAGYDVVLSSSHAVGKGIIPASTSVHACYCHTPMRYAWEMENEYLNDFRVPHILRPFIRRKLKKIRRWDLSTAKRVDVFLANSSETARRIQETYGRDATVIPPPVDDKFLNGPLVPANERTYYLAVARLVPYKRVDLLIKAANELKLPLVIAGTGQEEANLRNMAGPTVELRGFVPNEEMQSLFGHAKGFLFPQYEDAGVVALEAQACGTPVIAYGKGGALDSVIDGKTGVFFTEQTVPSLVDAIKKFETMTFDPETIRTHASAFSATTFRKRIQEEVEKAFTTYSSKH